MFNLHGYGSLLFQGTVVTFNVAISSLVLSVLLGFLGALGKLSKSKFLLTISTTYTTIIRGVPDLVLMLLIYFGGQMIVNEIAAYVGYEEYIDINAYIAGVLTIGFIFGAYMTETFRGAILAVSIGQLEAGASYGMTRWQVIRRILVPQMIRFALPSFGNNWLVMIKATAIVSIIGLDDLVRNAALAAFATREPFTFYVASGIVFLIFTTVSSYVLRKLEVRFSLGVRKE
jgi:arginine/ornithine transport system permease protein